MEEIQIIDIGLEEMMSAEDIAKELNIDKRVALALLSTKIIPSRRVHGLYTTRTVFNKNKHKVPEQI